jgi:hypothetical protein
LMLLLVSVLEINMIERSSMRNSHYSSMSIIYFPFVLMIEVEGVISHHSSFFSLSLDFVRETEIPFNHCSSYCRCVSVELWIRCAWPHQLLFLLHFF